MTASVKVPLSEWLMAVKPFLKTRVPRGGDVALTLENGQLVFRSNGIETQADAEGHWPGTAYVSWGYVYRSAKVPPLKDPVVVEVENDRLHVEGSVSPCRWTATEAGEVTAFKNEPALPRRTLDRSFVTLVSMGIDYTDEKIASLDLTALVAQAKQRKERLISEAAHILAPLEITEADLNLLVKKTLGYKMK